MKKMNMMKMATLCALFSLVSTFVRAEEKVSSIQETTLIKREVKDPSSVKSSMGYVDFGIGPLPVPIPSFGIGYRSQRGHQGSDISLQLSTLAKVTQVKGTALYHHYFKPNLDSQFYAGAGLGISGIFTKRNGIHHPLVCLSPEFVFGKQYKNETEDRRFFQLEVSWPTFGFSKLHEKKFSHNHMTYMPLVVLSYGIGF